jgi:intracellular septation protein A
MSNQKKPNFTSLLIEMAICIFIPSMILKKLSDESSLGTTGALVLALSLPLVWGVYEFIKNKKVGFVPALGFISILLTGGIGLLKLDSGFIAIKEAAIPLIIGLATLISTKTRFPLVKTFLYNDRVIEVDKVSATLEKNQAQDAFEKVMNNATLMLAGSFFLSASLNYALAKYFITSPSGTAEFNSQLGSMNLWSYPVIVLPSMVILVFAMFYIFRNIKKLTGLSLEEIMKV